MTLLGGAARFSETAIQFRGPRLGHGRHAFPRRARLGETVNEVLAGEAFNHDAHGDPVGLFLLEDAALTIGVGARGLIRRQALAHGVGRGFERGLDVVLDVGVGQQLHPRDAARRVGLAQLRQVSHR